jgi:hypothetical protein
MKLSPKGAEGASYSLLTTFSNVAGICGQNIAMLFAEIWFLSPVPPVPPARLIALRDVSNESLRNDDVGGLWKLQLAVSLATLVPLCLLHFLPKDESEQEDLAGDTRRSKTGGAFFLTVLVLSILWTIITAVEKFYRY